MKWKTFLIVFEGLSFGEKIKIWQKIADKSFKYIFLHYIFIPNSKLLTRTRVEKNMMKEVRKFCFMFNVFVFFYVQVFFHGLFFVLCLFKQI